MSFKLDLQQRHLVLEELGVTLELHSAARPESSPEVVHLRVRRDVTIPPSTEALVPAQTLDLESDLTTTIFSPEQLLAEQRMDQQVSPVRAALISGERLSIGPDPFSWGPIHRGSRARSPEGPGPIHLEPQTDPSPVVSQ
ncbi:hypothetical protein FJT64_013737 [Amphibalanus amphitrite]|uniref:Uncharacterized protein n=1 Tax=Amphibalanus amphitrite TaxID=1232801 RepID=A0A6A4VE91_AMPAM|nr:hypothetical protein FJT64_013737 [Amphibalanus amphitrite]